jgi:hypothetical protein
MLPLWSDLVGIVKRVRDGVQSAAVFGKLAGGTSFGSGRGRDGSLGKVNDAPKEVRAGVVVGNQVFQSEHEAGQVAAFADVAERYDISLR